MKKLDLRKTYKSLYVPPAGKCALVEIPTLQFAAINGRIEPGKMPGESDAFREALQALYGVSYTLKFISKQRARNPIDYTVMALEALWWVTRGTYLDPKQPWKFTAMILQPDHITPRMFAEAVARVKAKRPVPPPAPSPEELPVAVERATDACRPVRRRGAHAEDEGPVRRRAGPGRSQQAS